MPYLVGSPPVALNKLRFDELPRLEEIEPEDLKNYSKEQLCFYLEKHGLSVFLSPFLLSFRPLVIRCRSADPLTR